MITHLEQQNIELLTILKYWIWRNIEYWIPSIYGAESKYNAQVWNATQTLLITHLRGEVKKVFFFKLYTVKLQVQKNKLGDNLGFSPY